MLTDETNLMTSSVLMEIMLKAAFLMYTVNGIYSHLRNR